MRRIDTLRTLAIGSVLILAIGTTACASDEESDEKGEPAPVEATMSAEAAGARVIGIFEGFRWLMQGDTSHVTDLTGELSGLSLTTDAGPTGPTMWGCCLARRVLSLATLRRERPRREKPTGMSMPMRPAAETARIAIPITALNRWLGG